MKIYFLEAPMPLTKQFLEGALEVKKTPYPNAYEVSSHEIDVKSLKVFEVAIKHHASLGHCLVKGLINRKLVKESRAGSTDTNDSTEWLCLDIDGLPDTFLQTKVVDDVEVHTPIKVTVPVLLEALGLKDYSYILQWSASYGIESTALRCHIFILLDKPYPAPLIKQWLIDKNLSVPMLRAALSLTKTGNALSWPLDISACQNDKLLYIAPPVLKGIKDPLGKTPRITLVTRSKERFALPNTIPSMAKNREAQHKKLDELRQLEGLPKRRTTYKMHGSMEVLMRPDACIVTESKQERGFVYLNLNGGDSWGYFHPENNPDYIHNFKGEPTYLTKELLPDYWDQLHKQTNRVDTSGVLKLAFLDPATDRYYRGTYDTLADELKLEPTSSALALRHYCKANGVPLYDDVIPEWNLTFDPHDNVRVDISTRMVNTFQPSVYMRAQPKTVKAVPKTIKKVLYHVCGSDQVAYERFVNWLAHALQTRDRCTTAWVFHGIYGTGKGTLLKKILRPLWGHKYVSTPRLKEFEKEFNSFAGGSLLVCVDEVEADSLQNEKGVMADIRRYITEEYIPLRKMRTDSISVRNYASYIFFSNASAVISVPRGDRRMNVATYQPTKLEITDQELDQIDNELQAFHDYLINFKVNKDDVLVPLENAAREEMVELTENAIDSVANALVEGDMSFFIDQLPTDQRYAGDSRIVAKVEDYKAVIHTLLRRTEKNTGICPVARDELRAIFEYTVGKMPESPNKFTSLIKHHRIRMNKVWIDDRTVNGIKTMWRDTARWTEYVSRFAPPAVGKAAPKATLKRVK